MYKRLCPICGNNIEYKDKYSMRRAAERQTKCHVCKKPGRLRIKFRAISPAGEIYEDDNMAHFAREHHLLKARVSDCVNGIKKHTAGWRFEKILEGK